MHTVGAFEAKTHFSALLEEVQKGEHIIITKHGHPVAKLIPLVESTKNDAKSAIAAIKQFGGSHKLGSLSWKKLRDEGRR